MTFGRPLLLLTLLLLPLAAAVYVLVQRRRMRYAVRFTNVDVLAGVAGGTRWRRLVAPLVLLLAVAALCVAVARPHVRRQVASDRATIVLVLDVSGSMQANDVKPTRLVAAQRAIHTFLAKVPARVRVGLILFAGEADVATPPTADHALVGQAVDEASLFNGFGGTAIGDALAAAVQLGIKAAGIQNSRGLTAFHPAAAPGGTASTLVSILFLSDGHQTRGELQPLEGAGLARRAGIPVYTIALGTRGGRITNFPQFGGGGALGPFGGGPGFGFRGLEPDPATLRAIAATTGGKFFQARSSGAVEEAYAKLGSSLGRTAGRVEVTDWFVAAAALLLVAAGVLSTLWAPRLP